jgi:hypothetical protein
VSDSGQARSLSADGVELTRLLENLVDLVRLLAEVTTLEELLEVAGEHFPVGSRFGVGLVVAPLAGYHDVADPDQCRGSGADRAALAKG